MNSEIKTGTKVTVSQGFPTFQVFGIDDCQINTRELTKFASNYKKKFMEKLEFFVKDCLPWSRMIS